MVIVYLFAPSNRSLIWVNQVIWLQSVINRIDVLLAVLMGINNLVIANLFQATAKPKQA